MNKTQKNALFQRHNTDKIQKDKGSARRNLSQEGYSGDSMNQNPKSLNTNIDKKENDIIMGSEVKIPNEVLEGVSIEFNLKQCTVFQNKFGCYAIELRYGQESKRSPTINIVKEKINLNVMIRLSEVMYSGEDIYISLFNQTLIKNQQVDILVSQQMVKLSTFKRGVKNSNQNDQILTFSQDNQVKAEIQFRLSVQDGKVEEEDVIPKRNFLELLMQWMQEKFLADIVLQFQVEERRLADEEKLRQLKIQQEELNQKRLEDEANRKRRLKQEEEERRRSEVKKKQDELAKERMNKMERQKNEEEEKERKRILKEKLKEEQEKQRQLQEQQKREEEEANGRSKGNYFDEENYDLDEYENEDFEEYQEQERKQKHTSKSTNRVLCSSIPNEDDIQEDLQEEEDMVKVKSLAGKPVNSTLFRSSLQMRTQSKGFSDLPEVKNKTESATQLRKDSPKQIRQSAHQRNKRRNFMNLLKQWMCVFLKKIIKKTSLVDKLNIYTPNFYIFGDETFPFIIRFNSNTQKLDRFPIPKSLSMYRYQQSIGLPNGQIFFCGGVNSKLNNILPFCQLYDPYMNKGYPLPSMNQARYTHSAIYFNEYIYVIGGRTYGSDESSILSSFERYSLLNNRWEKLARLVEARCTTSLVGLSDPRYLYLVGGFSPQGRMNTIERYNIRENSWKVLEMRLPLQIEAGICFKNNIAGDEFYLMYGRGKNDRNPDVFKIHLNADNSKEDRIELVGNVKKMRVLPAYFQDDMQILYVFGGDEDTAWEKFTLPSFECDQTKNPVVNLLPQDMKMFCGALSKKYTSERQYPWKAEQFQLRVVCIEEESQSLFQFDSKTNEGQGKNWQTSKLNKGLKMGSSSVLLDNHSVLFFGGGKECFAYSLSKKRKTMQCATLLVGKRNSIVFSMNRMVYSFGGERIVDGAWQISDSCERFHLPQNKWERMASMPAPLAKGRAFYFESILYIVGGIDSQGVFSNVIQEYNMQLDYFLTSHKRVGIEFKHAIQFFLRGEPTPLVLLFSASFKQQGILNLLEGSFEKQEILPIMSLSEEEKRILRISQERDMVCFVMPHRIDVYRTSINSTSKPELLKYKDYSIKNGKDFKQSQHIMVTQEISSNLEDYDFIECDPARISLGQSKGEVDIGPDINVMFEDNAGQIRIMKQRVSTGEEQEIKWSSNDKGLAKLCKRSVISHLPDRDKIIITGGFDDDNSIAVGNVIEFDLQKGTISQIGEMITPRFGHCQLVVQDYVYMIGGWSSSGNVSNNTEISTNRSHMSSSPSYNILQQIAATRVSNTQAVIEIQSQLMKNNINKHNTLGNSRFYKSQSQALVSKSMKQSPLYYPKKMNPIFQNSIHNQNDKQQEDSDDEDMNSFLRRSQNSSTISLNISKRSSILGNDESAYLKKSNQSQTILKKVDRFNLRTMEMEQLSDMPQGVAFASCCELRGYIYVLGGVNGNRIAIDLISRFDPLFNIWQLLSLKLHEPLHSFSALSVGLDHIIIFGGMNIAGRPVKDCVLLEPNTNSQKKIKECFVPLLRPHSSSQLISTKSIHLVDRTHIQCLDVLSTLDDLFVREISPITCLENLKESHQILGVFYNSSFANPGQFSRKYLDNLLIFGNENNNMLINFDMRSLKLKASPPPQNLTLLSYSAVCYVPKNTEMKQNEQFMNCVVISGGVDFETNLISSRICLYKTPCVDSIKSQLLMPRFMHASVCAGSKVYFLGGKIQAHINSRSVSSQSTLSSQRSTISIGEDKQSRYLCTSDCEMLDISSGQIQQIPPMNISRSNMQAVFLLGHIYVFGGFGGDKRLRSIERYSPQNDTWMYVDSYFNSDLEGYQICQLSSHEVIIVGGKENGLISQKIFIFNAHFHTLTQLAFKLTHEFSAFKCSFYNDELFIFGVSQSNPISYSYNIKNGNQNSKIQTIPQLAQLDMSWPSVLTKSLS